MQTEDLVSKLIRLHEKADVHSSEYLRLRDVPGKKTRASSHQKKAQRLYSRIQSLIHQIARSNELAAPQPAKKEAELS